ncbi:MAG: recombinase family protein [Candidatus Saccharimonadales bacterium]
MEQTLSQQVSQTPKTATIRWCLYARKSSEQDERQALSIEQQLKEMQLLADHWGIEISEIRQESHSSKVAGARPIFNRLIKDIQLGYFNGIISWAPDRLSRSAGDLGVLVDLMDQGKLVEIRTHSQTFTNNPNEKFLLMILGSQAKLENDNRGLNVIRGLHNKAANGWRPGQAPIGYLNNGHGEEKIIVDEERSTVIAEMFERVGKQAHTGRDIKRWLNDINFRSRQGKRLALSHIYRTLQNPFYYGRFQYPKTNPELYNGKHMPIISKALWDEVQIQLTVAPKAPAGTKEFSFTKILKCGVCRTGITAEEKLKRIKSTGEIRRYVYYHCGRANDLDCIQPYIREGELMSELLKLVDRLNLDEIGAQEQFKDELERYQRFNGVLGYTGDELIQKPAIDLKAYAKYVLENGTREEKREILKYVDGELLLKDRQVYVERKPRPKMFD